LVVGGLAGKDDIMRGNPVVAVPYPFSATLRVIAENWWLMLLRGIAAVAFGLLAFVWPGTTLLTLVILFGAYAMVDGLLALGAAFGRGKSSGSSWWLAIVGALGIVAGFATFLWPGLTAILLLVFIGAWTLLRGILEIAAAIQMRRETEDAWLLALDGVISVIFGLSVLAYPGAGALALIWIIAAYAVASGVVLIMLSFRARQHRRARGGEISAAPGKPA
jgi:uncharacterized membrane protein HdeD (DUF308 family)